MSHLNENGQNQPYFFGAYIRESPGKFNTLATKFLQDLTCGIIPFWVKSRNLTCQKKKLKIKKNKKKRGGSKNQQHALPPQSHPLAPDRRYRFEQPEGRQQQASAWHQEHWKVIQRKTETVESLSLQNDVLFVVPQNIRIRRCTKSRIILLMKFNMEKRQYYQPLNKKKVRTTRYEKE